MNLFDCGTERNSSHFTALRILRFLLSRRGESSKEGQGYFEISRIIALFEDVFDDREDVIRTLNRLVVRQLLEVNTRSTESIEGASHVRVTSAGWYYSRFLAGLFSYLDLVLQDTPINDPSVERQLRDSVFHVDNLADREDEKIQRMQARFDRVAAFLSYLEREELEEHSGKNLEATGGIIGLRLVPRLIDTFEGERAWVEQRIRQNRERFKEDVALISSEELTEVETEQERKLFDAETEVDSEIPTEDTSGERP